MLIAVDTNVLLDQAVGEADVIDALEVIRDRVAGANFIVTPTVLLELANRYERGEQDEKKFAERALTCLREWAYEPLNLIPARHGIVEQICLSLRVRGILPDEEVNDGFIIAEAALLGCQILLSADKHLRDAQAHPDFRKVLDDHHVDHPDIVIATPRYIVQRFFKRR